LAPRYTSFPRHYEAFHFPDFSLKFSVCLSTKKDGKRCDHCELHNHATKVDDFSVEMRKMTWPENCAAAFGRDKKTPLSWTAEQLN
jgi:hypothetical protein